MFAGTLMRQSERFVHVRCWPVSGLLSNVYIECGIFVDQRRLDLDISAVKLSTPAVSHRGVNHSLLGGVLVTLWFLIVYQSFSNGFEFLAGLNGTSFDDYFYWAMLAVFSYLLTVSFRFWGAKFGSSQEKEILEGTN
jgi:hypothetical protein